MEKNICTYDEDDLKNLAKGTANIFNHPNDFESQYYERLEARDWFMSDLKAFADGRNEARPKQDNFVYYIVCNSCDTIIYDVSTYIYADLPYFHSAEDAMDAVRYFGERDFYKYYFNRSV